MHAAVPKNWLEAFELLKDVIRSGTEKKKIIFLDELSWMDTPKSDFVMALESFWNGWASARKDVVLIVCSSVTSWMLNKVIQNKGGLYNRLTLRIFLKPFSLRQCEAYATQNGLVMNRYQILQAYMVLGGIPYYWGFLDRSLSLSQNIDRMFFADDALLADEYDHLFSSLFRYPEVYKQIIQALAANGKGLGRNELLAMMDIEGSGSFSSKLDELEACGFIRSYRAFGKESYGMLYQLIDPFTIFCLLFLPDKPKDENFWLNQIDTPKINAWSGFAFERVCMMHEEQMLKALGITGVLTYLCSWSCKADSEKGVQGSQIDMLIVRKDQVINLLEMKFSAGPYTIDKSTEEDLLRKRSDFIKVTGTRSSVHLTMVIPYGIVKNMYAGDIQSEITAEDLFQ